MLVFQIILLIFGIAIFGLFAYALYLRHKAITGRGRFAGTVVLAIAGVVPTTALAVGNISLTSTAIQLFAYFNGEQIELPSNLISIVDYAAIFSLSFLVIRHLVHFGNETVRNWDGPATRVDLVLKEDGISPTLLPVTIQYLKLIASGQLDLPIDPKIAADDFTLSDIPPPPNWDRFARDLILVANNEIYLEEENWSNELSAWIGEFAPKYTNSSTQVILVPILKYNEEIIERHLEDVASHKISDAKVYFCVEEDCARIKSSTENLEYEVVCKNDLVFDGLNLHSYCSYLIKAFTEYKVLGSDFSLEELFVSPKVHLEGEEDLREFASVISEWETSGSRYQLSLVGEFGQGKSSAILSYCAAWAREWLAGNARDRRVPLLIPLRGRDPSSLARADFLAAWGDKYRLSGKALLNLVFAGKATLIFEGFDEVNDAGLKIERFRQFDALWRFGTRDSKIVFTGRPNFFIDDGELRRLLRIDQLAEAAGRMATRIVQLAFFDAVQLTSALRAFPQNHVAAIVSHFKEDEQFREVASRPSMLPLIALIWPTLEEVLQRSGHLTTTDVIQKYIEFEYSRKKADIERDSATHGLSKEQNYLTIPSRVRDFFMMSLARDMARSNYSNTITAEEFTRSVKRATPASETYFLDVDYIEDEEAYFQRVRTLTDDRGADEVAERLTSELRTTGLVARDVASGPNSFFFPHKQFYEYYLAKFACLAVGQRLSSNKKSAYDHFIGIGRPCAQLTHEPQAASFFVEMSSDTWYNTMFTAKLSLVSRLSIVFFLAPYFILDTLTSEYRFNDLRILQGNLGGVLRRALNSSADAIIFMSGVFILTALTFVSINHPIIAGVLALWIAISATMLAILAGARNILSDIMFWMYLLFLKMPGHQVQQAKKVLGVVTYSLVIAGQRSGLLSRRAPYGEVVLRYFSA